MRDSQGRSWSALIALLAAMAFAASMLGIYIDRRWRDNTPARYQVILLNPAGGQAVPLVWTLESRPDVEGDGMVSWVDSSGRYHLVAGSVVVQQLPPLPPMAAPVQQGPAQPVEEPVPEQQP